MFNMWKEVNSGIKNNFQLWGLNNIWVDDVPIY